MRLIDIVLEVERVLTENNITWRYVSSRNARTFILEDGTSTVITMRYDRSLGNYFIHCTKMIEGLLDLVTDYDLIADISEVDEVIENII